MLKQYATFEDFNSMTLVQVEKTLDRYLEIAESMDWAITPAFERDLKMLTAIAKAKGSKRRW